jgi:hypothetical protein
VKGRLFPLGWLADAFICVGCRSPWEAIHPVIRAKNEDRIAAMRSAPIIVLAEVEDVKLAFDRPREVEKPPDVGGPMVTRIPLYLARISGKTLLNLRGSETSHVEFYSWFWASGKHGGPRLFDPSLGSHHILFLTDDTGFLHTVGDYPAYDLQVRASWIPFFLADWHAGYGHDAGLIERIVALRLKAELESIPTDGSEYWLTTEDDVGVTSPAFVASQLESHCRNLTNPAGRAKACDSIAGTPR